VQSISVCTSQARSRGHQMPRTSPPLGLFAVPGPYGPKTTPPERWSHALARSLDTRQSPRPGHPPKAHTHPVCPTTHRPQASVQVVVPMPDDPARARPRPLASAPADHQSLATGAGPGRPPEGCWAQATSTARSIARRFLHPPPPRAHRSGPRAAASHFRPDPADLITLHERSH
jgi:hypothetical protein